ncbi:MAG: hypothetical protein P8Y20_04500 [Gammaproteobacteria bacterium]|jgi:hypothetical protein
MNNPIENGTRQVIDGLEKIYFDGYWIRYYEPPTDNLKAKKRLIQSLTWRLFNHMEHNINIPGRLLEEVRAAYTAETDPKKKRVKGAMVAGTLFNRAAEIFTHLVDLEESGITISPQNELMRTLGAYLQEALEMGKLVKHRNGDEGIDELWGEPFKAFVMSIPDFYQSRYIKIAMTMKNIDDLTAHMINCFGADEVMAERISKLGQAAKLKCEILRTDKDNFDVWSEFVVAGEEITDHLPDNNTESYPNQKIEPLDARHLLKSGVRLISFITRARIPMPQSTQNYCNECKLYSQRD